MPTTFKWTLHAPTLFCKWTGDEDEGTFHASGYTKGHNFNYYEIQVIFEL